MFASRKVRNSENKLAGKSHWNAYCIPSIFSTEIWINEVADDINDNDKEEVANVLLLDWHLCDQTSKKIGQSPMYSKHRQIGASAHMFTLFQKYNSDIRMGEMTSSLTFKGFGVSNKDWKQFAESYIHVARQLFIECEN